ncbi:hypothetical protein UPYG_G00007910 [Umbra pygmaea]|uniref:Uncharacterized protein n=1 Tax=Umbra pygmaea TaxID=75934 RepID=A0ABD0XHW3_UMBPY
MLQKGGGARRKANLGKKAPQIAITWAIIVTSTVPPTADSENCACSYCTEKNVGLQTDSKTSPCCCCCGGRPVKRRMSQQQPANEALYTSEGEAKSFGKRLLLN